MIKGRLYGRSYSVTSKPPPIQQIQLTAPHQVFARFFNPGVSSSQVKILSPSYSDLYTIRVSFADGNAQFYLLTFKGLFNRFFIEQLLGLIHKVNNYIETKASQIVFG